MLGDDAESLGIECLGLTSPQCFQRQPHMCPRGPTPIPVIMPQPMDSELVYLPDDPDLGYDPVIVLQAQTRMMNSNVTTK